MVCNSINKMSNNMIIITFSLLTRNHGHVMKLNIHPGLQTPKAMLQQYFF